MKVEKKRHGAVLVGAVLVSVVAVVACSNPRAEERQQIIDYIGRMLPTMERQADFYDEWWDFTQSRDLRYDEAMARLDDSLREAQSIYMEVERSLPPKALREFRRTWSKELQLLTKAISLALQGLREGDSGMLLQADDLIFEANDLKTGYSEDLLDILEEYNIGLDDL